MSQIFENKVKPTIVGGGIGGLSLAIGLQKHGITAEVYEAAPDINEVGAGIMLASNAMQVFKSFGIYDEMVELGNHISEMRITEANFKVLSHINLKPFEEQYGVHNVTIHRAVLQKKLMELVGKENISLGKNVQKLELSGSKIIAHLTDDTVSTEAVIGADGIHSAVRNFVSPDTVKRRAYQKCWRGVTEFQLPKEYNNSALEAWGKGKRFGMTRLNDLEVYWYALINARGMDETIEGQFDDFHPLAKELIKTTGAANIIENEIIDLKPMKNWWKGKVCLMGDAAHATTPNMGQGACQAIEDAYVLSKFISEKASIEQAFEAFQNTRITKAHQVVNRSWMIGKVSQLENWPLRGIRNFVMRLTPNKVSARQLASVFDLEYVKA